MDPSIKQNQNGFRFGLEAEFLLVDTESFRPLWHPDLSFLRALGASVIRTLI
jgi:hypothetical protein